VPGCCEARRIAVLVAMTFWGNFLADTSVPSSLSILTMNFSRTLSIYPGASQNTSIDAIAKVTIIFQEGERGQKLIAVPNQQGIFFN